MNSRTILRTSLGIFAGTVLALGSSFGAAPSAVAETSPTQTVTLTAKVVGSAVANAEATATASASGSSYAGAVAQVRSNAKTTSNCFWTTGWNTYYEGKKLRWKYDQVKAKVCKLKKPIKKSGKKWYYKKVAGGSTGTPCGNLFKPASLNFSYKTWLYLDVKSGTTAKVAVTATADVSVDVLVDVSLQYTYNGVTKTIVKQAKESASDHASDSATASMKVTKSTKVKTTAAKIATAKASVKSKAEAKAKAQAIAKAQAKAEAEISVVIEIEIPNLPPSGDLKMPQHLYVGGTYCAKFYGSDPEDKADVVMTRTISDLAKFVNETDNCSFRDDVENSQRVITQPIKAGTTPGTVTVTLKVTDKKGSVFTKTISFPVLADEFQ